MQHKKHLSQPYHATRPRGRARPDREMRPSREGAALEDGYWSITVAKYGLIRLIRFVSRISTQLSKNIYKHILFDTLK